VSEEFQLSGLGLQIKAHWQKYRPRMYRDLEKSGELDRAVFRAQERTVDAYQDLVNQGLSHHQAWEAVREEWAFLPGE
jgi:hypothetical protein